MTSVAVIAVSLAGVCFCLMHILARSINYKRERDAKAEIEEVKKELNDEILHGGNVARIYALKRRLCELESK